MTVMLRNLGTAVLFLVVLAGGPAPVAAQTSTPPAARDEFVPLDQLPQGEELPAAPLVVAAYSVVWVLFVGYAWSLSRRLTQVQRDIEEVRRQQPHARASGPPA